MNGFTFYVRKAAAVVLILLAVASGWYGLWRMWTSGGGVWAFGFWSMLVPVVLVELSGKIAPK